MEGMPHTQEHQQAVMGYAHNAGLNQQSPWNTFHFQNLAFFAHGQLQRLHSTVAVYATCLKCNRVMAEGEHQFGCVITYITSSSIEIKKHVLHMLTPSSVGSAYFQKELHCQTVTERNPNEIMVHSTTPKMDAFSKKSSNQQGNNAKIKPYNWLC